MDYYLIFGMVAVAMIAILGFIYSIKKSAYDENKPIQDLNITITKLNENFEHMLENDAIRDKRIGKHGEEIDENKDKIVNLEKVVDRHEIRLGNLENQIKGG